jgi:hypothetical protein
MVRLLNMFLGFPTNTVRSCASTFDLDGREATTADDITWYGASSSSVTDDFPDSCVAPVMKSTLLVVLVLNDRLTDLEINL